VGKEKSGGTVIEKDGKGGKSSGKGGEVREGGKNGRGEVGWAEGGGEGPFFREPIIPVFNR